MRNMPCAALGTYNHAVRPLFKVHTGSLRPILTCFVKERRAKAVRTGAHVHNAVHVVAAVVHIELIQVVVVPVVV